ncbi:DUF3280 domain-containing protein [Sagittula sp. MA-2]|jgi:hypothetical protein|uniref:DUF3280 domain-containing protein n=1 Tax=Sagittula sp. MA-2 TaxID=3048007 RepID=UPI0024C25EF6|nr:DUF3280 domain-containing protein [Sagittula sp. MA-2]WHZ37998.1 DUF3280 domain-containing protein [Sagittula sp. MA-2]
MRRFATFLCLTLAAPCAADEKIAFFGITLLDGSLQTATGGHEAEEARIEALETLVADRFREEGYDLVDIAPVQEKLDRVANPAKCYGCDARMATELGADFALVGEVQKISNLILTMNLQLRDAESGETVKGRVVDIRGNTDESWTRGMRYILKTAFFEREEK